MTLTELAERKWAMCDRCGCYYPPKDGHDNIICEQIWRWKYPGRAREAK